MRKSQFSEEQILGILKRVDGGQKVAEVCCLTSTRIAGELPHERRHFERVFASPIMSPDAGP